MDIRNSTGSANVGVGEELGVKEAARHSSGDAKTQAVVARGPFAKAEPCAKNSRTASLQLKSVSVKSVVASVKNLFATSAQKLSSNGKLFSTVKGIPDKLKQLFSQDRMRRAELLSTYEQQILPSAGRNKEEAVEKTRSMLQEAEKAGVLDSGLYKRVSGQLARQLNRQSIQLEDLENPPPSVHSLLLDGKSGPFFQKLSDLALEAQKDEALQEIKEKLSDSGPVDKKTAQMLVEGALSGFPALGESVIHLGGGKAYTTLVVPDKDHKPDVLIKEMEQAGSGAAAIVFKAYSLRAQTNIVVKYATGSAEHASEEETAIKNKKHLGEHAGIQDEMRLVTLASASGPKKVVYMSYYGHKDLGRAVRSEQFLTDNLNMSEADQQDKQKVLAEIDAFGQKLIDAFSSPVEKAVKEKMLKEFIDKHGGILRALRGDEEFSHLIDMFKQMIEQSPPQT